jgi:hypothetical protein
MSVQHVEVAAMETASQSIQSLGDPYTSRFLKYNQKCSNSLRSRWDHESSRESTQETSATAEADEGEESEEVDEEPTVGEKRDEPKDVRRSLRHKNRAVA